MALLARIRRLNGAALVLAVAAALLLPSGRAVAQDSDGDRLELGEQAIKAGLVYNFLKYTTWPESAAGQNHLEVCLFGADPQDSYLAPLGGQMAQQSVITLVRKDQANDTADCNMLFVDAGQKDAVPALLGFLQGRHVLTISDMDGFAGMGGMVQLAMEDKRIALYINDKAVDKAGLKIQARLLKLAKLVHG